MKKNKTVANKERNKTLAKRGIPLVLTLAVLILLVNVITASYSWFSPTSLSGAGMKFQQSDFIRSENCSLELFQGTKEKGVITYTSAGSDSVTVTKTSSSNPTEGLNFFRVVVRNADKVNASNVSILFNCTINAGTTIGIMTPSNAVHTYESNMTNSVLLVRNAYVKKYVSTEVNPGELYVDFFIRYTGSDSFSLRQSDLRILYN